MPFGFGIIGCGMIANFHAKAIAQSKQRIESMTKFDSHRFELSTMKERCWE